MVILVDLVSCLFFFERSRCEIACRIGKKVLITAATWKLMTDSDHNIIVPVQRQRATHDERLFFATRHFFSFFFCAVVFSIILIIPYLRCSWSESLSLSLCFIRIIWKTIVWSHLVHKLRRRGDSQLNQTVPIYVFHQPTNQP